MSHHLIVPDDYGFVLLAIFGMTVVYFLIGMIFVNVARKKTFTQEFMEKNFADEHKKAFGAAAPKGGYPDMGYGRYSQRLSYEDWYNFNNAQRVHYNYFEMLPMVVITGLISGLFYPIYAAIAIGAWTVGRIIYSIGYFVGGPNRRVPGAALAALPTFFLIGSAGYGLTKYTFKLYIIYYY